MCLQLARISWGHSQVKHLSSLRNMKLLKWHFPSSVFIHFASVIYLPSFSITRNFVEIDSSRHKASEQQTATPSVNWLIKVNNRNTPNKHFLFSKTSWRRLKDVISVILFVFQDVFKTYLQYVFLKRLQDVFKRSSRRVCKTSCNYVLKTSSVCLDQDECLLGCNKKWNVLKVNSKEARTTSMVSLFLTSSLTYSGVFIVNFEHISHLARGEKWQNTCFILEKRKESLAGCKLKCFSYRIEYRAQGLLTGFYGIWFCVSSD